MGDPKDGSFNKINYALRPQKQVERRLILEGLHRLMQAGFPITEYTYLGLGSCHYVDFILLHKYAHIRRMICAERRPIPRRMRFNKPYPFIQLLMEPVGSVIPRLNRRRRHLAWLDYDSSLLECGLGDIASLLSVLPPRSIFLLTVNAHSREADDPPPGSPEDDTRRERLFAEYKERFAKYYSGEMRKAVVSRRQLPGFLADVLRNFINGQLVSRDPEAFRFRQLFNYKYSDGAQMLTYGGLIDSKASIADLESRRIFKEPFTESAEPTEISIPPLTLRERQWLDQNLQRVRKTPDKLKFELGREAALNYSLYYREYPLYFESLL